MREPKKEIYNDVWFFYKRHLNGNGTDDFWDTVDKESKILSEKHKGDYFARSLLSAVINELEKEINKK